MIVNRATRTLCCLTAVLAFVAMPAVSTAREQQRDGDGGSAERPALERQFRGDLESLHPENPEAYFLLGEEIAAEAQTRKDRELARRLFVLALELERRGAGERFDGRFGASVCLALASLAPRQEESRWLISIATLLDDRTAAPDWQRSRTGEPGADAAFKLATALGLIRMGEGRRAQPLMDEPEVRDLLDRYETMLSPAGLTGAAAAMRKAMEDWPFCPECRNQRVVVRRERGQARHTLCYTCEGLPGPRMSDEFLIHQLRLESALLGGIHDSWSAQTIADGAAPVRDPDPSEIAAVYGVDADKSVWRDGQWVRPEQRDNAAAEADPDG